MIVGRVKETTKKKSKVKHSTRENMPKDTFSYGGSRRYLLGRGTVKLTKRERAKSRQMGPDAVSSEYLWSMPSTQAWWQAAGDPQRS